MNDFTQEELEDIFTCVHSFKLASIRGGFNYYDNLNDKIKSMIDNYCEHEWNTNPYNYVLHCQKCGRTIKNDAQGKIL